MYAHLHRLEVVEGQHVVAGQPIGEVGNTTNGKFRGMGPHLHFEIRRPGPQGRAPVPGPYRTYNLDPVAWFETRGIRFGPRGHITEGSSGTSGLWAAASGLGGLGQAELDLGAEGLPDEPVRDPWTFDPLPAWFLVAGSLAAASTLVVGGYLFQRNVDWGLIFEGR
jgi:murein DD-endopeptidase MepM/ murein hydrolase activator NlpD